MKTSKRTGFKVSRKRNSNGTYHYEVYLGRVDGKRVRRYFKSKEEAETFSEQQRVLKINQGTAAFSMSDRQRVEATECIRRLEAAGATLTTATDFFLKHAKPTGGTRTWSQAVQELLASKKSENMKVSYIQALKWSLNKFGKDFEQRTVNSIFAEEVEDWLEERKFGSPATRRAYIRDIGILFRFCVSKGYAAANPVEKLKKPKLDDTPPAIFTVVEARKLLRAAHEHPELNVTASLAIGLFAGLRTSELESLTWSEIKLKRRTIEVTARKAKTRRRRLVKISPNLAEWLAPLAKEVGLVVQGRWRSRMLALRGLAGVEWKANGMRHSFASYHLAGGEDANSTALALGHANTEMLFAHYRELVDPEDANEFWKISPTNLVTELSESASKSLANV